MEEGKMDRAVDQVAAYLEARLVERFGGRALVGSDDAPLGCVSADEVRAALVAEYDLAVERLELAKLAQDALTVERDPLDPSRLTFTMDRSVAIRLGLEVG